MRDVIVIGAGASGLLTGALAGRKGLDVLIIERNNIPAKKLYATGNGHCNFVNEASEASEKVRACLESFGITGAADEAGRYYPRSREAAFVVQALENGARRGGAEILCDCHITEIKKSAEGFKLLSKDGRSFECKKLVIAAGGKAGIQYGCYGEGYRWVQQMGHSLVKPIPALVAMECTEDISSLHGVRVNGVAKLYSGDELVASDAGEIQFTKDSISGICVMNLSGKLRLSDDTSYSLSIDLFPEFGVPVTEALFFYRRNNFGNELSGLVPEKLAEYISSRAKSDELSELAELVKDLRFSVTGTKGWDSAQVTAGGVPMDELSENFESRKTANLFIAGELQDYDGPCGGFNLGHAFLSAMKIAEVL